jgi:hypothetical protein
MAFDILPFAVDDNSSPVAVGIGATGVTLGVRPAPQTGAMGCIVTIGGVAPDGLFDLIVETADGDTPAGGLWFQTNSRENAVTGTEAFRIPIADPILDQVRLRIVRVGGTGIATLSVRWYSDRAGGTLN